MAISNELMGGKDFRSGEHFIPINLKDTIDKIVEIVEAGY